MLISLSKRLKTFYKHIWVTSSLWMTMDVLLAMMMMMMMAFFSVYISVSTVQRQQEGQNGMMIML